MSMLSFDLIRLTKTRVTTQMLYVGREVSNLSPLNFTAVFILQPASLGQDLLVVRSIVFVDVYTSILSFDLFDSSQKPQVTTQNAMR